MLVAQYTNRAAEIMEDPDHSVYSNKMLIQALNEAVLIIANARPDSTAAVLSFSCVAGSEQTIPENCMRLLDVIGVRESTDEQLRMDSPNWRKEPPTGEFEAFVYDERSPRTVWLYPSAAEGDSIQLLVSTVPAWIDENVNVDQVNATIKDEYFTSTVNLMCHRLSLGDITNANAPAMANEFLNAANAELTKKLGSEAFMSDKKERGYSRGN